MSEKSDNDIYNKSLQDFLDSADIKASSELITSTHVNLELRARLNPY